MDFLAYLGTLLLLGASLVKRRFYLHVVRFIGTTLWLFYGIHLNSYPLMVTEATMGVIELFACYKFRRY